MPTASVALPAKTNLDALAQGHSNSMEHREGMAFVIGVFKTLFH